jgi:hypothetical protein
MHHDIEDSGENVIEDTEKRTGLLFNKNKFVFLSLKTTGSVLIIMLGELQYVIGYCRTAS